MSCSLSTLVQCVAVDVVVDAGAMLFDAGAMFVAEADLQVLCGNYFNKTLNYIKTKFICIVDMKSRGGVNM